MFDSLLTFAGAIAVVLAGFGAIAGLALVWQRLLRRRDEAARMEVVELARLQADTAVRIDAMREMIAGRQAELQRAVNERLDSVTHHLGQSMTANRQQTVESISKLHERLAVIAGAPKNSTGLRPQLTPLQR